MSLSSPILWIKPTSIKIGEFDTIQELDKIIETNNFLSEENVYDIWDDLVIPLCEEDMEIDEIERELDSCYEELYIIDSKINNLLSKNEEIKEKIERLKSKLAETA